MNTKRLLPSLFVELFQTEYSTYRHSMRETERLGFVPPGAALRVIAVHASFALDDIGALRRERGLSLTTFGSVVGDAFTFVRQVVVDRFADHEQSYRDALLEARRGIDLVRLLRIAASDEGDEDLVAWCDRWLPTRSRLVREAADELEWFGHHPTFARRHVIPILGTRAVPA